MENVMSLPQGKSTSPDYDPSGSDEKYFAIPIVIFPCKPSLGVFLNEFSLFLFYQTPAYIFLGIDIF